jgi:hypothetical protein
VHTVPQDVTCLNCLRRATERYTLQLAGPPKPIARRLSGEVVLLTFCITFCRPRI